MGYWEYFHKHSGTSHTIVLVLMEAFFIAGAKEDEHYFYICLIPVVLELFLMLTIAIEWSDSGYYKGRKNR